MKTHDGRYFMPPLPEWEYGTWEGAEYANLRDAAAKTFPERLDAVEEMGRLAEEFREAREAPAPPPPPEEPSPS
ncbi:MAG: hypothetical protein SF028_01800 [Candidatus Sumerlaeia bacterium]|nr:hypothetical protein [Candidatus Sumerlaeia bacterium]